MCHMDSRFPSFLLEKGMENQMIFPTSTTNEGGIFMYTYWEALCVFEDVYDKYRKRCAEKYHLTPVETNLLLLLGHGDPHNTAADLCRMTRLAKSRISVAVNSLFEKGLIEKKDDPFHGKKIRLYPTEAAQEILAYGREIKKEMTETMFTGFTEEERTQFLSMIDRVIDNLDTPLQKNNRDKERAQKRAAERAEAWWGNRF